MEVKMNTCEVQECTKPATITVHISGEDRYPESINNHVDTSFYYCSLDHVFEDMARIQLVRIATRWEGWQEP